jgi:RHS repeat-associated protein
MFEAAKEEIFSVPMVWTGEGVLPLAADPASREDHSMNERTSAATHFGTTTQLSENSRLGFERKNVAPHQGSVWSNSASALGIARALLENRGGSRYTGKERDSESGLDNFGARYDSSQYGRFMSVDPDNESGLDHMEDPQSWNGYAYVRNNPLVLTDPDGMNYRVCDDKGENCANLTNEQFAQYRQDSGNISMRASGDLYAGDTKVGNASYYDETNADGAAHIAGSQLVINEFAKQAAINATIGAIGRGIGLGIEAVQAARAASAAEELAEVSNLATKAAATVGNQTARVGSKEAAAAAAKEFLGPGAEQITDRTTGAASGWKSADGTRVVIDSHADQVGEHMNFINKATGGNLHVRW